MRSGKIVSLLGVALLIMSLSGLSAAADQDLDRAARGAAHANAHSIHGRADGDLLESTIVNESTEHAGFVCDGDSGDNSDTGHGANQGEPYDNTCPNGESGNGNGNGESTGKPCAGCVGEADDKNPKGQLPGPQDHNNGYECDGNHGIARTNPAHTGCRSVTPNPPTLGFTADVPALPCGQTTLTIAMDNLNNAAGGSRTFVIKIDGTVVDTEVLAAGKSGTSKITIPDDGAVHTVSVETGGVVADSGIARVDHDCDNASLGAGAAINDLACDDTTADVTAQNLNSVGARTFTVTVDGTQAATLSAAPGSSSTTAVTVPDDGLNHTLAVLSSGSVLSTKTLKVTHCGGGSNTRVLGAQFNRTGATVAGAALPRTGSSSQLLVVVGLAVIGLGMAMSAGKRLSLGV